MCPRGQARFRRRNLRGEGGLIALHLLDAVGEARARVERGTETGDDVEGFPHGGEGRRRPVLAEPAACAGVLPARGPDVVGAASVLRPAFPARDIAAAPLDGLAQGSKRRLAIERR